MSCKEVCLQKLDSWCVCSILDGFLLTNNFRIWFYVADFIIGGFFLIPISKYMFKISCKYTRIKSIDVVLVSLLSKYSTTAHLKQCSKSITSRHNEEYIWNIFRLNNISARIKCYINVFCKLWRNSIY